MKQPTLIGWAHYTQNFWMGCDKCGPECANCYIIQALRQQHLAWGTLRRTRTWNVPANLQRNAAAEGVCYRVFTCSLSDFFHNDADPWRDEAWDIIRKNQNLVWLILTKRPDLAKKRLPTDWPHAFPNAWLGVTAGCRQSLRKMDTLREIPVHEKAVRFLSAEPLLEDISDHVNLDGFGWVIAGGESGAGPEHVWDSTKDWRKELETPPGRRTMDLDWARRLLQRSREAGVPFFFKQITAFRSGQGEDALGSKYHEVPPPPHGRWADKPGHGTPAGNGDSSEPQAAPEAAMAISGDAQAKGNIATEQKQDAPPGAATAACQPPHAGGTGTRAESAPVADEYHSLDATGTKNTYDELNSVLENLATAVVQTLDQMVPHLAKMQSLLSQRGAARKRVLKKAGLPTWTQWANAYAAKLDRSLRTVQDRIRQFHARRESGTSAGGTRPGNGERVKLDTRQQAALVKAQLATSDLVGALEKGGDWKSALAAYKKVAVSPERLDSFVNACSPEPDWKKAFTQLVSALEPHGEALPDIARKALLSATRLLGRKTEAEPLGPENRKNIAADRLGQKVDDPEVYILEMAGPSEVLDVDRGGEATATAVAEHETSIASPTRRSVRSMTINKGTDDERTVEKGYTCKYNGIDCEITEVFSDSSVLLLRSCDGNALAGNPTPIRELRFIAEKPNASSKRSKSHDRKADGQTVASEELSAGPMTASPDVGPEESGGEAAEVTTGPRKRQGDFTRHARGGGEYNPLPQRFEQSAGV